MKKRVQSRSKKGRAVPARKSRGKARNASNAESTRNSAVQGARGVAMRGIGLRPSGLMPQDLERAAKEQERDIAAAGRHKPQRRAD